MKKLIGIITALCLLSGFPTDCISDVIEVFADPAYTVQQKETAIDIVTEQLEDLYNCLLNGENPYSSDRNCNP